jgi:hypothetical protein
LVLLLPFALLASFASFASCAAKEAKKAKEAKEAKEAVLLRNLWCPAFGKGNNRKAKKKQK